MKRIIYVFCTLFLWNCRESFQQNNLQNDISTSQTGKKIIGDDEKNKNLTPLDTSLYNQIILDLVHHKPDQKWPVKTPYPLPGALLPFHRIVAYYGNLYTSDMGILGQKPADAMLKKLMEEVDYWQKADSLTSVLPALHYLAVTAQHSPGKGKMYRLRMPDQQIDEVLDLAGKVKAITILDIQVGHSTLKKEIPELEKYLMMDSVHLGIDPEWSMKTGHVPGKKTGTMDAEDINYAIDYLSDLVKKHQLPPKLLIIHRFTKGMITNYKKIKTCPEVQIVINMDGFGFAAKKISTYRSFVAAQPVQFTGFKLFYKNDAKNPPHKLMSADEILDLFPKPIYIQYQ
ncbi:MAG: hypothetical protein H7X99_05365 [Saprospiraceae bacterium]|nr:hypothetical protein [Saprospiraceae bacterium]